VTRIAWRTSPGPSILEVSRNFETQLAKAGFETRLACDTDECGGIPFTEAIDALPVPQMWLDGFNYRYTAGRKLEAGREIWASVAVTSFFAYWACQDVASANFNNTTGASVTRSSSLLIAVRVRQNSLVH